MTKNKILFFDTETTGLPKNWKAPVSDLNNWPRMVQLAWLLFDIEGNQVAAADHIVLPIGYQIPPFVAKIHGITQARAEREGEDLKFILDEFLEALGQADTVVAHNVSFDVKIIAAELLRNHLPDEFEHKKSICTMMKSAKYCGIKNRFGFKWPTLAELHYHLFQEGFTNAHNAAKDIEVTARCFWELRKHGVL